MMMNIYKNILQRKFEEEVVVVVMHCMELIMVTLTMTEVKMR